LHGSFAAERWGGVVVTPQPGEPWPDEGAIRRLTSLPVVIITVAKGEHHPAWRAVSDVLVDADDPSIEDIVANVSARPRASVALALLLRGGSRRTLEDGLVAESATYSALQSGREFADWRASRPTKEPRPADDGPRVRVCREAHTLVLTLARPHKRNALDARMRDELVDGLSIALADPDITQVELRGEGPSFCAGGDLDEFGSRPDPASAHVVRLQRHVGRILSELAQRTTAYLHGPCAGAGIELPAFVYRVVARRDTTFSLPEIGLGLIPGAGGTVSLVNRIGRLRTAWLALSTRAIDIDVAKSWGLIDEVSAD
jgi:hypothetical protein